MTLERSAVSISQLAERDLVTGLGVPERVVHDVRSRRSSREPVAQIRGHRKQRRPLTQNCLCEHPSSCGRHFLPVTVSIPERTDQGG